MTRMITIVNTSNWPGESFEFQANGQDGSLEPGQKVELAVSHDSIGDIRILPTGEGKGGYHPYHVHVHAGEGKEWHHHGHLPAPKHSHDIPNYDTSGAPSIHGA